MEILELETVVKFVGWLAAIVISAALGWITKAYLDKAKPAVTLASISADSRLHEDKVVKISGPLIDAYGLLPIQIENFSERMNLSDLIDADDYVSLSVEQTESAARNLSDAIAELDKMSGDTAKQEMRRRVLEHLSKGGAINLESVIRRALLRDDSLIHAIKGAGAEAKYGKHPAEEDLPNFGLTEYRHDQWSLSERHVPETLEMPMDIGTLTRYIAITNLITRVLIYCDKTILKTMLDVSLADMKREIQSMNEFSAEVKRVLADEKPMHIWCEVVLLNSGKSPALFDGKAELIVKTASSLFSIGLSRAEGRDFAPIIVKGGESSVVVLKSSKISEVEVHELDTDGTRLRLSSSDPAPLVSNRDNLFFAKMNLQESGKRERRKVVSQEFASS